MSCDTAETLSRYGTEIFTPMTPVHPDLKRATHLSSLVRWPAFTQTPTRGR